MFPSNTHVHVLSLLRAFGYNRIAYVICTYIHVNNRENVDGNKNVVVELYQVHVPTLYTYILLM